MNKEELLEKARNSGNKEGVEQQSVIDGAHYGGRIFSIVIVFFLIYTFLKGRFTECYLVLTIFFSYFSAYLWGLNKVSKDKSIFTLLFYAVIPAVLFVFYLARTW